MAGIAALTNGGVNGLGRELISKAEFARRIGVSRPRVTKLSQQGRLILEGDLVVWPDSKDTYLSGRDPDSTIKNLSVDQPRRTPTDASVIREETAASTAKKRAPKTRKPDEVAAGLLDESKDEIIVLAADAPMAQKLVQVKHMQTWTKAKLAQIELAKERGRLVGATEVQDDAESAAIELKTKLMNVPARCAVRCEGKTAAEIEVIMQEEIIACMKVLNSSKFMKDFV